MVEYSNNYLLIEPEKLCILKETEKTIKRILKEETGRTDYPIFRYLLD